VTSNPRTNVDFYHSGLKVFDKISRKSIDNLEIYRYGTNYRGTFKKKDVDFIIFQDLIKCFESSYLCEASYVPNQPKFSISHLSFVSLYLFLLYLIISLALYIFEEYKIFSFSNLIIYKIENNIKIKRKIK
jgi:hypothetical protein